uniref:Uncharacterized protein n=1 Tax=Anabas testudineus TaxID=64144 RepID=A0A3Q1J5W3_ANATE
MIVLICVTLVFSVRSSNADTGASVLERFCQGAYCITLPKEEITAEAGLCVVIPCSFSMSSYFTSQYIVWSKCEPTESRCGESDIIFDSDENNRNIQAGFMGRVSLLESDVSEENCSIVINDLRESDSGSYELRVNGLYFQSTDRFIFSTRATVNVTGLSQKPTVIVPPLIEGHQTTLTCTAPGLCSGSVPEITWTWRKPRENDSHIPGNITEFRTETLTAVTQRHSSTLTFNTSAEHHSTEVTCKVNFKGDTTTEETVTLNMTCLSQKPTVTVPPLIEGHQTTLTCTAPGLCSGSVPEITWTWRKPGKSDSHIPGNITEFKTETLTAVTQRHSSTLTFNTSAEHHDTEVTCKVNFPGITTREETVTLNVTFLPKILKGSGCEVQSDVLTCVCISEGFPVPTIRWPLLEDQFEYSVITTVSNHTVTSTVIHTVKDTVVECVSSNINGDMHYNLITKVSERQEGECTHNTHNTLHQSLTPVRMY